MLNQMATREDNIYRHKWTKGDLMLIDQRTTMHFVFPDYDVKSQTRVMQRTTITDTGDAPGTTGFPRPVGVTGLTGDKMMNVEDDGSFSPRNFKEVQR